MTQTIAEVRPTDGCGAEIVGIDAVRRAASLELRTQLRRIDRLLLNSLTTTRTDTQAWQPSQYGT